MTSRSVLSKLRCQHHTSTWRHQTPVKLVSVANSSPTRPCSSIAHIDVGDISEQPTTINHHHHHHLTNRSLFPSSLSNITTTNTHVGLPAPPAPSIITRRQFSSNGNGRKRRKGRVDPFRILQVRRQTPYATVKKLFLKVAMQHHPDTSSAKSPEEQDKSRDIFIKTRQAFEALAEDPETGGICLREELDDYVADEEHAHMDEWFKKETGYDMPFMDEETMKEVAKMTEAVGGGGAQRGLDRDGGMWELARMVTRTVKSGGDGKNLLRLEAGEIKETEINDSNLRARRRRRHTW